MINKEKEKARRYDTPARCSGVTETVYCGERENKNELFERIKSEEEKFFPAPPEYKIFYGELHGHCALSDGKGTPESYFLAVRDKACLDFAALTDHDHGGVGGAELWGDKWEETKSAVKKFYEPHKFTTILAYEKDAYPFYNNSIVYYSNHDGEMLRGKVDGEMSREELISYLNRDDILIVPHDTSTLFWGTDFLSLAHDEMPRLTQIYSRYNYSERYDARLLYDSACEGGHWIEALNAGAKIGCVAGSDDHGGTNGLIRPEKPYPAKYPGITAVLAKENTVEGIFEALKARRCYGFMGGRIALDFRINGHYMGEEIVSDGARNIFFNIECDGDIDRVTLVKNGRDYIVFQGKSKQLVFDYKAEKSTDYYYLRAELTDGRMAWSSPIWVTNI